MKLRVCRSYVSRPSDICSRRRLTVSFCYHIDPTFVSYPFDTSFCICTQYLGFFGNLSLSHLTYANDLSPVRMIHCDFVSTLPIHVDMPAACSDLSRCVHNAFKLRVEETVLSVAAIFF